MINAPSDLSSLCIHTITTKPWDIETSAKNFAGKGVKGISVWRDTLAGRNIKDTGRFIKDLGLDIVSLCRGGFFPSADPQKRKLALDDNRRAIEEAFLLGTDLIVLVCGAEPAQSLHDSRLQIQEGIMALIPEAKAAGVRLAIEPLHPMYADTRSAISTLSQANTMAEAIHDPSVGVAVDVYHLWWDDTLEQEIYRCGKNNALMAFHICDWNVPTVDMLNDRGLMGEGCIRIKEIMSWVKTAGFTGYNEVEIFSNTFWQLDQSVYLDKIISAYKKLI